MEKLYDNELLLRRIKKAYRHGRGAAAHFIDCAAAAAVSCILLWFAVRSRIANGTVALFITAVCALMAVFILKIVSELRFGRFVKAKKSEARNSVIRRKALLNYEELCEGFDSRGAYICRSFEAVTADDAVAAKRAGAGRIISAAEPTESAKKLLKSFGISVVSPLDGADSFIESRFSATEAEIEAELTRTLGAEKKRGASALIKNIRDLSRERAVRYVLSGTALILLSFTVRYSLYYRLMGSVLIAVGSVILSSRRLKAGAEQRR